MAFGGGSWAPAAQAPKMQKFIFFRCGSGTIREEAFRAVFQLGFAGGVGGAEAGTHHNI